MNFIIFRQLSFCVSVLLVTSAMTIPTKVKADGVCVPFGLVPASPLTYDGTDGGTFLDNGVAESRMQSLNRSYILTFTCTGTLTNAVNVTVDSTILTAPVFASGGASLDLVAGGGSNGVDHRVTVALGDNTELYGPLLSTNSGGSPQSAIRIVDPGSNGSNIPLDVNNRIRLVIQSRMTVIGTAEEMAAGNYQAQFDVQIDPL
jgi:hypothetical protein